MRILKLFAVLLAYPSSDLVAVLPQIAREVSGETALRPATQDALAGLLAELKREDLLDSQARYVAQFDMRRSTSLHLFEHVHGDSRDRGQAMVDLKSLYERAGLALAPGELPDFLPAMLEYLSTRSPDEVRDMLGNCEHILRAVGERLVESGSPYAAIIAALLDVQNAAPLSARRGETAPSEPLPDDDWQEIPVDFGPSAAHSAQQSRPQFIRFVPRHTS